MPTQTIKVQAVDSITFVKTIQEVVARGARYDDSTYVYVNTMPMMAEFTVDIPEDKVQEQWTDNGPNIYALKLPIVKFKYSKEQLNDLSWEDFKTVCSSVNIGGKSRDLMTRKYIDSVTQEAEQETKQGKEKKVKTDE